MKHLPAIVFALVVAALLVWMGLDGFAQARPHHSRIRSAELPLAYTQPDGGDAASAADGGDAAADGGDAAADGGDAAADGGDAAADGGDAAADGGDAAADGGDAFVNDLSIDLDGVDESLIIADSAAMEPGAAWSFCGWFKEDTLGSPDEYVDKFAAAQTAIKIRKTNNVKVRIDLNSTSNNAQDTNNMSISNGVWYHTCVVYNGGGATDADKVQHYVNATSQTLTFAGTIPTSITNTTSQWQIGGGVTGFWGPGNIDEVTFWSTNLDQTAVTALYNSGHPGKPSTTNLVAYYHMGEWETFPTAIDNTAVDNGGTYTNMESGDIVNDAP